MGKSKQLISSSISIRTRTVKRKPNPKIIGAFVTAALVLLVAMILFFGSSSFFSRTTRFILFFDQSVNGLNVGSPVKFRGVPVGAVERILIRAEGQDPESTAIPVVIKIDRSRLEKNLGVSGAVFDPNSMERTLERGLVAQLNLESFITGQLFVEFSFEPERAEQFKHHLVEVDDMVEIPTLASSLDQITGDLAQLIADVSALDLERLNENLNNVLENLSVVLAGIDSKGISGSVTHAAEEVSTFVGSVDFGETFESLRLALADIRATAKSFNLEKGPMANEVAKLANQFSNSLDGLDKLVAQSRSLLEPDSNFHYELENTLRELRRAAQSIRVLTDYLERNPNALITGRAE